MEQEIPTDWACQKNADRQYIMFDLYNLWSKFKLSCVEIIIL